ncbi:hypothetical protein FSP39_014623 [Pinctada imbricata]|uniref:Coiled-coil domain-containing protein 102A n=1 Tax=Pinctada imbricata TaxID=66713 RepID=A0AA88XJ49_PINIB|nr:hypothetical protein FSP39_014623 [Pinctada imbricata]
MSQKIKSSHSGGSKGDVSCIRATVTPVPMAPSPAFRDGNHTPVQQMANMDAEWDGRDELLQRELEEARARTSQMEKTMRWWSDCTANWREKWSKVRNERNKAREENRQLRAKLEQLVKECTETKRKNQELTAENTRLKDHNEGDRKDVTQVSSSSNAEGNMNSANSPRQSQNSTTSANNTYDIVSYDTDLISSDRDLEGREEIEDNLAEEKAALYELKLDEAQKTLMAERGDKTTLTKSIERLQLELASVKSKYEDIKRSKQDVILEITKVKEDHKEDILRLKKDLEDEMCNKSNVDKKLGEVRRELEKLQRENADEWGKRERLETDKFALERENKKLRSQIEDLEEQLDRKKQQTSALLDSDVRTMQLELSEKTKLNDLRHSHTKVKKALQDKITDLEHTRRRADQYEMEVKKLRGRVDELKKELANTEDEVDTQSNMVRKVQRTNDELQEMVENLQVQLNHTESR